MRYKPIQLRTLALLVMLAATAAAETPTVKMEPLETAYKDLIATDEQLDEYKRMTEVQLLRRHLVDVRKAAKECLNKTYSVRLRVTAVTQPLKTDKRLLVHAQYVDQKQIDLFGKHATVGIWTDDVKTAALLHINDEIDLQGKIFYDIRHASWDVDRLEDEWKEKDLNISVAYLRYELTGMLRQCRVFMVNPQIIPIQSNSVEGDKSDRTPAATVSAQTSNNPKIEPLSNAYVDLIATEEELESYKHMTEVQKLQLQLEKARKAARECRNKTYGVRLRVTGVQPGERRMMVHAQYVDQEQCDLFGKGATIAILTADTETASKLHLGDEIELRGKIFYQFSNLDKFENERKERNINTSVASLRSDLTGLYSGGIVMVNPQIVRIEEQSVEGQR